MAQVLKARRRPGTLSTPRLLIVIISTVTGVCFAVLAGLSISEMIAPVRTFHPFSIVIAVVSLPIAFLAFRAARTGHTDAATSVECSFRGMIGAFIGFIVMASLLFLFRPDGVRFVAHALGQRPDSFSVFRLLLVSILLGFGAGFVALIRVSRH